MNQFTRAAITAIGLWSCSVFASFELSPIIASVTPGGPGATTAFTITNGDDSKTPVQLAIFRREPDAEGNEKYEEAKDIGDMFQIFPAQMILNPKEKRTVRVTYVGDPKITRELAFRIIAEEFPINVSDERKVKDKAVASIAIATKYIGSLYVTPSTAQPSLTIEGTPATEKSQAGKLLLTLENKGSRHILLKRAKFKVVAANKQEYQITDEFQPVINANVLAGKVRKFVLPWPKNVPVGPLKVTVELPKQ